MVEYNLPKVKMRVRFPSSAPVTFLLELFIEQIDIKINQRNNQGGLYYRIMILY